MESCYLNCEGGRENGCFGANRHLSFTTDVYPCVAEAQEHSRTNWRIKWRNWSEEDTHGDCPRCPGAAGGNHHQKFSDCISKMKE